MNEDDEPNLKAKKDLQRAAAMIVEFKEQQAEEQAGDPPPAQ